MSWNSGLSRCSWNDLVPNPWLLGICALKSMGGHEDESRRGGGRFLSQGTRQSVAPMMHTAALLMRGPAKTTEASRKQYGISNWLSWTQRGYLPDARPSSTAAATLQPLSGLVRPLLKGSVVLCHSSLLSPPRLPGAKPLGRTISVAASTAKVASGAPGAAAGVALPSVALAPAVATLHQPQPSASEAATKACGRGRAVGATVGETLGIFTWLNPKQPLFRLRN